MFFTTNSPQPIANSVPPNQPQPLKRVPKQSKIFFAALGIIIFVIFVLAGINIYINNQLKKQQLVSEDFNVSEDPLLNPKDADICRVGGFVVNKGELNPVNDCQVCQPVAVEFSQVGDSPQRYWLKKPEHTSCGNQGVCSADGICVPKLQPNVLPEQINDSLPVPSLPPR